MELLIHGARSEFRQCKESAVVGHDATEPSEDPMWRRWRTRMYEML